MFMKSVFHYELLNRQMFIPLLRHYSSRILLFLLVAIAFVVGCIFSSFYNLDLNNECSKHKPLQTNFKHLDTTYLIVVILSSPENVDRRQTIRTTWLLTKDNYSIRHYFALSTRSVETRRLMQLKDEQNIHKDLMLLETHSDSYSKLSEKVKEVFKWIDKNCQYKFLLKVDDDSFVQLNALYIALRKLPQEKLYWGFFDGHATVKTRGKWKEENWFLCDKYLPYALGGGYVLSQDLIQLISLISDHLMPYKNEDASLGVWLAPFKVNRIHDSNFDTEFMSRGCLNSYLITHKQTLPMMKAKYRNLIDNSHLCPNEEIIRKSYIYNWNVLPSRCCIRT